MKRKLPIGIQNFREVREVGHCYVDKTPHIDALARRGAYFPNAVVTTSLCSPSRATILAGQTTRNHRVVDNNNSSEEGLLFFPKHLQTSGYQTGFSASGTWATPATAG